MIYVPHDPRHPPYCWCRWSWTGRQRWAPCARDADTPDGISED